MKISLASFVLVFVSFCSWGQVYTTAGPGNWSNPGTWLNNGSPAVTSPTAANSTSITINHAIIADATISVDQTTVSATGSLSVNNGVTISINNGTGNDLSVSGGLTVNGTLTNVGAVAVIFSGASVVNNGTINLTSGTLTLNGAISIGGTPVSTTLFTVTESAGATVNSSIGFSTNGLFTVNGSTFTESGGFTANAGVTVTGTGSSFTANVMPFSVTGALTVSSPGTFTTDATASPTINGNLTVSGTLTTNAPTTFGGTTVVSGTGAKTFSQDVTVTGSISASTTTTLSVGGNLVNNGTINFTNGTWAFTGSSKTISGTSPNFFNLTIANNANISTSIPLNVGGALVVTGAAGSLTTNASLNVTGSMTVNGTLVTNSGFNAHAALTVAGTFTANNTPFTVTGTLTVNTPGTFTTDASANPTINGNLAGTGAFTSNAPTIFGGTTVVSGTGAKTFNQDVTVTGSVSGTAGLTLGGNLVNNGTVNFTNGTSTFTGSSKTISGTPSGFFNLTVANGASASTSIALTVKGTMTVNGTLVTNAGFDAQGALTVSGTLTSNNSPFTVAKTLTITAPGIFNANSDGTLSGNLTGTGGFVSTANTTFSGGAITMSGTGTRTFNNLVVSNTTLTSSSSFQMNGNVSGAGILNSTAGVATFAGTTALISGGAKTFFDVTINSGSAVTYSTNLGMNGNVFQGDGSLITDASNPAAVITFTSITIQGAGTKDFTNVAIAAGTTTPNANYTVRGNLAVTGILAAGNATTTFSGATSITQGVITFNNIIVSGLSSLTLSAGTIRINGNIDNSGTINPGTGTVQFGGTTAITNSGTLNLNNVSFAAPTNTMTAPTTRMGVAGNFSTTGIFNNGGGLIEFNGSGIQTLSATETYNSITVDAGATISSTIAQTINGAFVNNGTVNFTVGVITLGALSTTDITNPSASTTFGALTTIAGAVITDAATTNVTIKGNFIGGADLTSLGTVIFGGATTMSGAGAKIFNNIVVNGTLNPSVSFQVNGNVSGAGTITATAGTATFAGPSTLISGGTKTFFDVTINSGAAVTYSGNVGMSGNVFQGDGSLTTDVPTSPAIVTFTSITIQGAGTKDFTNVAIGAGTTTPNANYTVRGNLNVVGTLAAGTATTTFSGNTIITQGAITFNTIIITNSSSLTLSAGTIRVNGNINNSGTVNPGTGTVQFGGTCAINNSGVLNFNSISFAASGNSVTAAPGSGSVGTMGIAGNFANINVNSFNPGTGTIDFNGTGLQTLSGVSETFNNVVVSNTSLSGVTSALTQTIGGTFTNNGNFALTGAAALILNGASTLGASSNTSVVNLTFNSGASINAASLSNLTISGNFTGTGNLTSLGTTIFNGTCAMTVAGSKIFQNLTVNGVSMTPGANMNYTINGDLSGTGTLNASSGTALTTFGGTTITSGTGVKNFNNVVVNVGASLGGTVDLSINGTSFTNNGTINLTGGTLTLGANCVTQLADLPATSSFNGLKILGSSMTAGTSGNPSNVTISGDFLGTGSFISNGTTNFNGTTSMTGAGAKTFKDLVVDGTMTPGLNINYTVNGNVSGSGTLNAGTGGSTTTFPGTTVMSGTGTKNFNNLILPASGSLSLPNSNVNANDNMVVGISGDITLDPVGILDAGTSTITMNNGTGTQNISANGKSFYNLSLTNGADAALTNSLNLLNILSINSDNSDLNSSGNLTLISTASNTAIIGSLAGTSRTVTGNVNVQRFIVGEGTFYRHISSPVAGPSVEQIIQSGVTITGPFIGSSYPCAGCATNNQSFFYYNESAAGSVNTGFVAWPPSGQDASTTYLADNLTTGSRVGIGYNLYVRNEVGSPTITLTGPINSAAVSPIVLPTSYTHTGGGAANDGWNFVGNPLPATIDWDASGWTKPTGILGGATAGWGQISVWDPTKGTAGGYRVWNGSVGDLGSGRIAPGQGFWIQLGSAGGTLSVTEAVKTNTLGAFKRVKSTEVHAVEVILLSTTAEDRAYIQKIDDAKGIFDSFDGSKLPNPESVNLYTMTDDNVKVSINAIGSIITEGQVPLYISDINEGDYTLSQNSIGDFKGVPISVIDKFTHKIADLSEGKTYSFTISGITASSDPNRFVLVFGERIPNTSEAELAPVTLYPNPASENVSLKVNDSEGMPVGELLDIAGKYVGTFSWEKEPTANNWTGTINVRNQPGGMYIVRVKHDQNVSVIKFIKN